MGGMRIAAPACLLGLCAACTPAQMTSSVVVSRVNVSEALVRTSDDLSPGDVVHVWRLACGSRRPSRCRYRQVGRAVVTTVVPDSPAYALVQIEPGSRVAVGDRTVKDSPMFYWHPEPPSE
jgi:hypothetical protein